ERAEVALRVVVTGDRLLERLLHGLERRLHRVVGALRLLGALEEELEVPEQHLRLGDERRVLPREHEDLERAPRLFVLLPLDPGPGELVQRLGEEIALAMDLLVRVGGALEVADVVIDAAEREVGELEDALVVLDSAL